MQELSISTYKECLQELETLLVGRWITDLANTAALLYRFLPDINWSGFYLAEGSDLWLGPFMGLPACTSIAFAKGVCGTAASQKKTLLVPDVHAFPGHIACDPRSRSEIVVPLIYADQVIGVLDVDSASTNRFSQQDQLFLESVAALLLSRSWPGSQGLQTLTQG